MKRLLSILQRMEATRGSLGEATWFFPRDPRKRRTWMLQVELLWEPRDAWWGVFWKTYPAAMEFYASPVLFLPVRIYLQTFAP